MLHTKKIGRFDAYRSNSFSGFNLPSYNQRHKRLEASSKYIPIRHDQSWESVYGEKRAIHEKVASIVEIFEAKIRATGLHSELTHFRKPSLASPLPSRSQLKLLGSGSSGYGSLAPNDFLSKQEKEPSFKKKKLQFSDQNSLKEDAEDQQKLSEVFDMISFDDSFDDFISSDMNCSTPVKGSKISQNEKKKQARPNVNQPNAVVDELKEKIRQMDEQLSDQMKKQEIINEELAHNIEKLNREVLYIGGSIIELIGNLRLFHKAESLRIREELDILISK